MSIIILTEENLKLLDMEGFLERFFHHCRTAGTYEEAYLRTEREYYRYFRRQRFRDYLSFKSYKYQYLKKREK